MNIFCLLFIILWDLLRRTQLEKSHAKTAVTKFFNDFTMHFEFPTKIHHDKGAECEINLLIIYKNVVILSIREQPHIICRVADK